MGFSKRDKNTIGGGNKSPKKTNEKQNENSDESRQTAVVIDQATKYQNPSEQLSDYFFDEMFKEI